MQMKDNEVFPPVVVDHGKGVYLYDTHGKAYLDIISSWWCNLLGHCNPEINEALKKQVDQLEHVIFTNFTHKPAIELCRELEPLLPKGLTKFTFHDNGSSSVEAALKMAFQYQYQTGHPERTRFMCLPESYHGETIGALSVGSMDLYAKIFHPMLMNNIHFKGLDCYRCPYGKTRETCNVECFESAEEAFRNSGKKRWPALWSRFSRVLRACGFIRRNTSGSSVNSAMSTASSSSMMKLRQALAAPVPSLPLNMPGSLRISSAPAKDLRRGICPCP